VWLGQKSKQPAFVIESVQHEIDALMAMPVAVYGAPDVDHHAMSMKEEHPVNDSSAPESIIRLQERMGALTEQSNRLERMIESGQQQQTLALKELATAFNNAFTKASSEYVTRTEFHTVKNIVNGAVAIILVAFIGGLVALVIR